MRCEANQINSKNKTIVRRITRRKTHTTMTLQTFMHINAKKIDGSSWLIAETTIGWVRYTSAFQVVTIHCKASGSIPSPSCAYRASLAKKHTPPSTPDKISHDKHHPTIKLNAVDVRLNAAQILIPYNGKDKTR